MLDYMCGLQAKFFHAPSFPDLEQEIATLHDELVQRMDRADRRKLLELGDLTDELSSRITLASFTAGLFCFHMIWITAPNVINRSTKAIST